MSQPFPEEPWTTVPRKKKKNKNNRQNPHQSIPPSLSTPSKDITPLSLHHSFTRKLSTFHQTPSTHQSLLSTLAHLKPSSGWQLTNALCLATGTFSSSNLTHRERALWQLVIFVEIVRYLREEQAKSSDGDDGEGKYDMKVYAQEPRYGEVDKEFLEGLGIEVLEVDEEGVLEEDEREGRLRDERDLGPAGEVLGKGSFLYEPFMAMGREQLRKVVEADPGLYVGSAMVGKNYGERVDGMEWIERFAVGRRMYRFPTFEPDPTVFDGMGIFGKEEEDEDDD